MATRKPRPPADATKPAFVVADAAHTDFLGLTKREAYAAAVVMGLFAGPEGRLLLKTRDPVMFQNAADVALYMGDVMVARGRA